MLIFRVNSCDTVSQIFKYLFIFSSFPGCAIELTALGKDGLIKPSPSQTSLFPSIDTELLPHYKWIQL